jgi:hypothetical protein
MEMDDEEEDEEMSNESEDEKPTMPPSNGLDELHGLAQKLSGNFTIAPAMRTSWSKLVYESMEDGVANADGPKERKKDKTFGGGLFKIPTDVINAKNKVYLKDKVR